MAEAGAEGGGAGQGCGGGRGGGLSWGVEGGPPPLLLVGEGGVHCHVAVYDSHAGLRGGATQEDRRFKMKSMFFFSFFTELRVVEKGFDQ